LGGLFASKLLAIRGPASRYLNTTASAHTEACNRNANRTRPNLNLQFGYNKPIARGRVDFELSALGLRA